MKTLLIALIMLSTTVMAQNKRITVMVIDTGVNRHKDLKPYLEPVTDTEIDYIDNHGHGTHVAGIIAFGDQNKSKMAVCPEVQIISCKYYNTGPTSDVLDKTLACLKRAVDLKVDYVNYSSGGQDFNKNEHDLIMKITQQGAKMIVAAGNDGKELLNFYPARYAFLEDIDNLIPVGNLEYSGSTAKTSNFTGGMVYDYGTQILSTYETDQYAFMTGSSQAAAMYTHRLLLKQCKKIQSDTKNKNKLPGPAESVIVKIMEDIYGKRTKHVTTKAK